MKNDDLLKHSAGPPLTLNPDLKFIYIFGDPVKSVISLFRRDLHHPHSKKMELLNPGESHLIPEKATLMDYAKRGTDHFGFQKHFTNWQRSEIQNDILFIRLETMHRNMDRILDYLDLDQTCSDQFPKKIRRNSDPSALPSEIKEGLQHIYTDFRNQLDSVPDIFLKEGVSYSILDKIKLFLKWTLLILRDWLVLLKKSLKPAYEKLFKKLNER